MYYLHGKLHATSTHIHQQDKSTIPLWMILMLRQSASNPRSYVNSIVRLYQDGKHLEVLFSHCKCTIKIHLPQVSVPVIAGRTVLVPCVVTASTAACLVETLQRRATFFRYIVARHRIGNRGGAAGNRVEDRTART